MNIGLQEADAWNAYCIVCCINTCHADHADLDSRNTIKPRPTHRRDSPCTSSCPDSCLASARAPMHSVHPTRLGVHLAWYLQCHQNQLVMTKLLQMHWQHHRCKHPSFSLMPLFRMISFGVLHLNLKLMRYPHLLHLQSHLVFTLQYHRFPLLP